MPHCAQPCSLLCLCYPHRFPPPGEVPPHHRAFSSSLPLCSFISKFQQRSSSRKPPMSSLCSRDEAQRGEDIYPKSHSRGNKKNKQKKGLRKEGEVRYPEMTPPHVKGGKCTCRLSHFLEGPQCVHFTGKKTDAREPQPDTTGVAEARLSPSLPSLRCSLLIHHSSVFWDS